MANLKVHDFHKMTEKISPSKTLSIFYTNTCSVNTNTEKIENLQHDIDFKFGILTLTETWNPESKKEKFQPKKIDG